MSGILDLRLIGYYRNHGFESADALCEEFNNSVIH